MLYDIITSSLPGKPACASYAATRRLLAKRRLLDVVYKDVESADMPNPAQFVFVFSFLATISVLLVSSRYLISHFQLFQNPDSSSPDARPNVFAMAWGPADSSVLQINQLVALACGVIGTSVFLFVFGRSSESKWPWTKLDTLTLALHWRAETGFRSGGVARIPVGG